MLSFRGLRCEYLLNHLRELPHTHQSTASQKSDKSIKRENNDPMKPTTTPSTQIIENPDTMSKSQNGNIITQTNQIFNKNLQVNGGTNGEVSSRKVTTLRDATQVRTLEQDISYSGLSREISSIFRPRETITDSLVRNSVLSRCTAPSSVPPRNNFSTVAVLLRSFSTMLQAFV